MFFIGGSISDIDDDDDNELNNTLNLASDQENSYELDFDVNNMSIDAESIHQQRVLSQLIEFIHTAKLNKSTTTSLLSLLRSIRFSTIDQIPKTTDGLWKQLDIQFYFDTFYFCSECFLSLNTYQDICPHCSLKQRANSELCIFSLADEIKRVLESNIEVIQWYSLHKHHFIADIVNGSSHIVVLSKK